MPLKTPDFTPAQLAGILLTIVTMALGAYGLNITDAQKGLLGGVILTAVTSVWFVADAIIRHGRASNAHNIRPPAPPAAVAITSSSGPGPTFSGTTFHDVKFQPPTATTPPKPAPKKPARKRPAPKKPTPPAPPATS